MPTVRTYEPNQVATQLPSTVSARPVVNGGQQLAAGIQDVANLSNQLNQRSSLAAAQEATTQFEREKNRLFFDKDIGYFNKQGRDAFEGGDAVSAELEKLRSQYGESLDPIARQEFDRVTSNMLTRSQADIMRHSAKNLEAWEQANIQAEIENTLENAALYSNNIKQLDDQYSKGRTAVFDAAKRQGLSPEATNEKLQNYDSAFAVNVISAEIKKGGKQGKAAMELWGDDLEGPDKVKMSEALRVKTEQDKDKMIAEESVIRATSLVATYAERTDSRNIILEEVNKIEDAELRKRTMSEVTYQLNLKKQADSEERAAIFEIAEDALYAGESMEQFKANNIEAWAKLSPKQRKALQSSATIITDPIEWNRLQLMDRDELRKVDPNEYVGVFERKDVRELTKMVKEAREPNADDKQKIKSTTGQTRAQMTKNAVEQVYGKNISGKEVQKVQAFYRLIDAEVRRTEFNSGKELTSLEYSDLLANIVRTTYTEKGTWFNIEFERDLDELSAEDIRKVSIYMTERNVPFTDKNFQIALKESGVLND